MLKEYIVGDTRNVLILVLVEHALGGGLRNPDKVWWYVLILVLVEHALGVSGSEKKFKKFKS